MLPRADIITVRPVGAAELVTGAAPVGDARQEQFQRSLAGLIGQSVQAEVMSKLTDGSFLVKVADTSARMMLPPGAQIGQRVPLTLVSIAPRPTFQITSGADDGTPVHIAYAEAGPALLPGPDGSPARAQPLVYLDGSAGQPPGAPGKGNRTGPGLPAAAAPPVSPEAPSDADGPALAVAGTPAPPAAATLPPAPGKPAAPAASLAPPVPGLAPKAEAADDAAVAPELPDLPAALEADPDDPASFLTQPRPSNATGTPAPATAAAAAANAAAAKALAGAAAPADEADPAAGAAAADVPDTPAAAAAARAQGAEQARPLSHAAALLGKAPIMPANQLPALGPQTATAALSDTAKVLAQVLTEALKIRNAPTSIIGRSPLVASGDAPPAQIEQALQGAVGKSGLFYESHVAQWAFGQRPLAELVVEPQMQQALGANQAANAGGSANGVPTDPATAGFINLQLTTHEQEKVSWQGQVWPGQDMQWEIKKDAPDRRGGREQEEPGWQSAMRLRFAQLGTVDAKVLLRGDTVQFKIHAGSAETAELFRRYGARLEAAMAAAGLPLTLLQVTEPVGAPPVPPGAGAGHG
jgi:hypothetical protein